MKSFRPRQSRSPAPIATAARPRCNGSRPTGFTVICIAQRAELILQADHLLRLSQGQVDAFGPRDEILGRAMRAANVAATGADSERRPPLPNPPAAAQATLATAGAKP